MDRKNDIRKEILLQAYAVRPLAVSAQRIHRDAKKAGYDYTLHEVVEELQFVSDNGLLIEVKDPLVTATMYRIHALGVTYYEQHYAA